jgi:osmoprotectant transport system substrate-binding protein
VPRRGSGVASERLRAAVLGFFAAVLIGACSPQDPAGHADEVEVRDPQDPTVRVASFDFAESELLGELFAEALEREGVPVERVPAFGSREVLAPALQQGMVDVVPEYLAAALDFELLGAGVPFSVREITRRLTSELDDAGITVLPYAPAVDRDAIAMLGERAEELGIDEVADLAEHAGELDFVGPPECQERESCLPRLHEEHGLAFRSFTGVAPGPPVALALAAGEADVGLMFSTDPLVSQHELVLLSEPKARPEHVVPLVRDEVLHRHGSVVAATLGRVTRALTTEELLAMNGRVADGESPRRVAGDWLDGLA